MFQRTNWAWVRDWAQRITGTIFLLATFGFLASGNVMRPGGVLDALPTVLLYALAVTVPVAAAVVLGLAIYSNRQGGRHDT
ncbi:MAG: hypothetical protein RID91_22025 [Azospirillaceae bacterium]